VNYFGPFYVKRGRGKTTEKRWGVIFTYMNSRAVHLDVARSLETDAFILVLIRFLNRRGHVKEYVLTMGQTGAPERYSYIHIFMFTDCKNNRFQWKLMMQNMNI
jgi:hypothetical protein